MANRRIKILFVGDRNSGKKQLIIVFATGSYPDYVPVALENCYRDIEVDGKMAEISLWDTCGQEDYDRLRPLFYPDTEAIVMCFSVGSYDTLWNITEKWAPEVRHFCPTVPIILVGTKKELRYDDPTQQELKKSKQDLVKIKEGRAMAKKIGAFAYLECSELLNEGVHEVFETATRAALVARERKRPLYNQMKSTLDSRVDKFKSALNKGKEFQLKVVV